MMKNLLYLSIVLFLGSCVSQSKVKMIQEKTNKQMTTTFENSKAITYRLQSGDHLYIRVNSTDPKTSKVFQTDFPYLMNNTYQYLNTHVVDEFGYISFSFIEKLYVVGLTVPEVTAKLQQKLDEYFNDATAFVKMVNFQVGVLGEVNSPGNFTIEQDLINIFQALGLAGGITSYSNVKEVKLVRQTQTGSEVHVLDLSDNQIISSPYYYLMPNDVIYIEPRGAKSFALEQFPYQSLLYFFSLAILGYGAFVTD
ncbi:MAG: polysaccharide biosynthesis/export family protein [Bacteroidales bacterium]|nr:polysaccharide biosynthesis/export family protein [Bacteroidales bacterium]MBN2818463.1 polysaccharide biosynthesis/export family protein [Bacteroidales bacterium]